MFRRYDDLSPKEQLVLKENDISKDQFESFQKQYNISFKVLLKRIPYFKALFTKKSTSRPLI